jgi:hypothetical protein
MYQPEVEFEFAVVDVPDADRLVETGRDEGGIVGRHELQDFALVGFPGRDDQAGAAVQDGDAAGGLTRGDPQARWGYRQAADQTRRVQIHLGKSNLYLNSAVMKYKNGGGARICVQQN